MFVYYNKVYINGNIYGKLLVSQIQQFIKHDDPICE